MEVTVGLAESNGSLLPGIWRDSLHVTCGLTACTLGSALGPTLGNEYGKTLPFTLHLMDTDYVAECLTVFHGNGAAIDRIRTDFMSGCRPST